MDLIYLAENREQWWSLMNTCSKMCEKFIKYLTVYTLLKNWTLWKGLTGQVYLGMDVNSEPDWGAGCQSFNHWLPHAVVNYQFFISVLIRIKTGLTHYATCLCMCVLAS